MVCKSWCSLSPTMLAHLTVSVGIDNAADGLELLGPGDIDTAVQMTATAEMKPVASAAPPSSVIVPPSPASLANRSRSPASSVALSSELRLRGGVRT